MFTNNGKILLKNDCKILDTQILDILSFIRKEVSDNVPNMMDLILFGSYARGDQHEYSDMDILVLMNDERSSYWMMKDFLIIDEAIMNKFSLLTNFLPFTERQYNDPVNYGLAYNVWKEGVRIVG